MVDRSTLARRDGYAAPAFLARPAAADARIWWPGPEESPFLFRRGALAVAREPLAILRHGIPLALSPAEGALLALLIRRGRASHREIAETLREAGVSADTLDILVHRIRRKCAAAAAPNPVQTRRGWGLILQVEPDMHGSTALWIGRSAIG